MQEPQIGPERLQGMTGVEKATVLLLAMGKVRADQIVKQLESHELKLVAKSVAKLGSIERPVIDELVSLLVADLETGSDLLATTAEAEMLISGVVPDEQADEIIADLRGETSKTVWPRLSKTPDSVVANFIANEHPQVGAFVLSKVSANMAAAVLREIPTETRNGLVRRMLSLKPVSKIATVVLEESLATNILSQTTDTSGPSVHSKLAEILNMIDKPDADEVLTSLRHFNPNEAKLIKDLLFSFEDIVKISAEARAKLFDEVPTELTITALKGASPEVISVALEAVSARAKRMIEQELKGGAKASKKDVQDAQRRIAELALKLKERGAIELVSEAD